MTTFRIYTQTNQKTREGKSPISIRLTHKRQNVYLKTEFYATAKQLDKDDAIKDRFLLRQLNHKIEAYEDAILKKLGNNVELYTAKELKIYLLKTTNEGTDVTIDFVKFSRDYIGNIKDKQKSRARRITTTVNALIDFFGREKISIAEITSKMLKGFEEYLMKEHSIARLNQFGKEIKSVRPPLSASAIHDYMADIKVLFNKAREEFNDDDKDEILISHNPFTRFKMPKPLEAAKRSLSVDVVRSIINADDITVNGTHSVNRANLARDVFALSFLLVGMNTIDLFNIETYKNGRLTYKRTKTRGRRSDEALISIKVEPEVLPLIAKYRDKTGKRVFNFYDLYSTYETFNANVNKGLKHVTEKLKIEDSLSTYFARHSWATIGRNDCDLSREDIHVCLNHIDNNLKVTDLYIAKKWTVIDNANRKVIDLLFEKNIQTPSENKTKNPKK
jgi:hypothetical protein